jgi:hypothetical protein
MRINRGPQGVEISLTPEMIEQVFLEWEALHPGQSGHVDMGADEFTRRMMIKIRDSARIVPDA